MKARRSPHGERGLKFSTYDAIAYIKESLSSRRAWIEIKKSEIKVKKPCGCSPHGERGLKSLERSPWKPLKTSLSSRRAWIEIIP